MKKASTKDILRTIWKEKKRFISIMMITVLGVTLMTGLEAGCRDLKISADQFYDSQKLFDISVMSTLGLTEDDVLVIQRMEEVEKAEGTFSEIVHTKKGDVNRTAEVKVVQKNGLNVPYVLEGRLPESSKEIAVSETYLKETGKNLGDFLTIRRSSDLWMRSPKRNCRKKLRMERKVSQILAVKQNRRMKSVWTWTVIWIWRKKKSLIFQIPDLRLWER